MQPQLAWGKWATYHMCKALCPGWNRSVPLFTMRLVYPLPLRAHPMSATPYILCSVVQSVQI